MATLKNDLSLHNLTYEDAIGRCGDYWQQAELHTDGACRIMMMMMSSIDRQRWVVVHAVRVRLPTSTKLKISHSSKKINYRHTIVRQIGISLVRSTQSQEWSAIDGLKKLEVQSLTDASNGKTCKYDVRITSSVRSSVRFWHGEMSLVRLRAIMITNHPPSVLWHCWLGHLACKNIVFEMT